MSTDGIPRKVKDALAIKDMRQKGLDIGMRVDVLVSEGDIMYDDVAGGVFVCPSEGQDSKGNSVRYVGRVGQIKEDSFYLHFGWNVAENKPLRGNNFGVQIYGSAVKDYTIDAAR